MTVRKPLGFVGRFDLFEDPDRHDITVWDGSDMVATVFHRGSWFARFRGQDAKKFDSRGEAIAYTVGVKVDDLPEQLIGGAR